MSNTHQNLIPCRTSSHHFSESTGGLIMPFGGEPVRHVANPGVQIIGLPPPWRA